MTDKLQYKMEEIVILDKKYFAFYQIKFAQLFKMDHINSNRIMRLTNDNIK